MCHDSPGPNDDGPIEENALTSILKCKIARSPLLISHKHLYIYIFY